MRRGTTAPLDIVIGGVDLTNATLYVSLKQGSAEVYVYDATRGAVTRTYDQAKDETTISITYTQAQTLSLSPGRAYLQVRWIFDNGSADATRIVEIMVQDVQHQGEIVYV